MAVAGALWLAPAQSVVKHRWRQKIQRHLELCHVQVLAASAAPAIIEGRDNGGKRKTARSTGRFHSRYPLPIAPPQSKKRTPLTTKHSTIPINKPSIYSIQFF